MSRMVVRGLASRIPEETIEKIRTSVDIVDVIAEYVQLKKQGRNFFGLCPFHDEKTPSFSVSADKQIYFCFGCQSGGNVFSFIMDIEGCSFPEAVQQLGEKVHIDVPNVTEGKADQGRSHDEEIFLQAHALLSKFYHYCLTETNTGKRGLLYLQQRGFTTDVIRTFQLGYAPQSWELTANFLSKRGFSQDKMQQAGVLSKREFDGKYFDRFRDRIMFPIWDRRGRPVAFGGRMLEEGDPKYLNSPESSIFHKGKMLYGFHLARAAIREKKSAILMEGYVDVVKAHQAGIKHTVASLGTSLTSEQAYLLRRHAETVIICYDSDRAGVNAAFRAAEVLEEAGCHVKIAQMTDGRDPDDYIDKYGGRRFESDIIGTARTTTAFKMAYYRIGKNLQDEGDRMRYIEEVLRVISGLRKAVERDHYLRQLADEFSLSLDALKQQQYATYRQMRKKAYNKGQDRYNNALNSNILQKSLLPAYQNAERMLLAYMMNDEAVAQRVRQELGGSFYTEEMNAIIAYLYAYYSEGNRPDIGSFMQRLPDEKLVRIVSEIAMIPINEEVSEQEIADYIHLLKSYPEWLEIEEMEKQKEEAERLENTEQAARIAMQIIQKKKEMKGSLS